MARPAVYIALSLSPLFPPSLFFQVELKQLEPELQKKSLETQELMERLEVDQKKANEVSPSPQQLLP